MNEWQEAMGSDLEAVPGVATATVRMFDNGELVFTLDQALDVIHACTAARIAVLGIEVLPGLNVSTYDSHLKDPPSQKFWSGYVTTNNVLAEDFVRKNPAPKTSECVLTTASWREFCEIGSKLK
jgi:hypothetical protein